jgi:hypothetical protein
VRPAGFEPTVADAGDDGQHPHTDPVWCGLHNLAVPKNVVADCLECDEPNGCAGSESRLYCLAIPLRYEPHMTAPAQRESWAQGAQSPAIASAPQSKQRTCSMPFVGTPRISTPQRAVLPVGSCG